MRRKNSTSRAKVTGLTPTENEILNLIREGYTTAARIAAKRGTGRKAAYKVIRSLKLKGFIKSSFGLVETTDPTPTPPKRLSTNYVRVHGQQFSIQILNRTAFYDKARAKGNVVSWKGHTIKLHRNSIEVYGRCDFTGETAQEAFNASLEYWNKFFMQMENRFRCVLIKPQKQNVRMVAMHIADVNNPLARKARLDHRKIQIYGNDDGRLWATCDFSNLFDEFECVHPETAKPDFEKTAERQLNDWRDNNPPTLSELHATISRMVELQEKQQTQLGEMNRLHKETAAGLASVVKLFGVNQNGNQEENNKEEHKGRPDYFG